MKALVRNKGETVTETDMIVGIDWSNGAPLTNGAWFGGPYRLIQNYVPPAEDQEANYEEIAVGTEQIIVEEDEDDYVVIDGKRYSKEELRALL